MMLRFSASYSPEHGSWLRVYGFRVSGLDCRLRHHEKSTRNCSRCVEERLLPLAADWAPRRIPTGAGGGVAGWAAAGLSLIRMGWVPTPPKLAHAVQELRLTGDNVVEPTS